MAKYGMFIDISKCVGCYNCMLACRDEHCGNDYPPYSLAQPFAGHFWMRIIRRERGQFPKVKVAYTPVPCMHCENATCISASLNNAVYHRPDGIVIIDPEKAAGQNQLVSSCPYRVIYWNEEKNIPQKCTFCAHLLDKGWKEPRCVEVCPSGALIFGDLEDPKSKISQLIAENKAEALNPCLSFTNRSWTCEMTAESKAETLHPEYGLKEKIFYINLPKRFIAGTVVFGDKDECAENVVVALEGDGLKRDVTTDNYGDFEFEGLPAEKEFLISLKHPGYTPKEITVRTKIDVYLGEIILT